MFENLGVEFNPYADIHPVRHGGNIEVLTHAFHPLASASADRYDTLIAKIFFAFGGNQKSVFDLVDTRNGSVEIEIDLILEFVVEIFEYHVVFIRAEMTNLRV